MCKGPLRSRAYIIVSKPILYLVTRLLINSFFISVFSLCSFSQDYEFEENNIRGLRSELTSVMERTRQGDVKQFQLEHSITRMEEELSSKTTQIVELNERLSDKVALVTSLESKLTNRNNKIVALQTQLDDKQQEYEDMEKEVGDILHGKLSGGERRKKVF